MSLGDVLELVIKQSHSGNLQGYFLPSVRDQGTELVIEGPGWGAGSKVDLYPTRSWNNIKFVSY